MPTNTRTKTLPAKSSSFCEAFGRNLPQISIVKIVDEELKIDVREDIKAANMTANMRPRTPEGNNSFTSLTKARFVHPDLQKKKRNVITQAIVLKYSGHAM